MNSKEIVAYKCSNCGQAYLDKSFADKCCEPKYCEDCGIELPYKWYSTTCTSCQSIREFNNGKVLTMDEFLQSEYKDNMVYYDGRYYVDIDDCLESILDCEIDDVKYIKATDKHLHELDADSLIEELECNTNCEEDIYVEKQGVIELENFLAKWNEKYRLKTYGDINVYIKVDDYLNKEREHN